MRSLGYNVPLHMFIAFTVSGFFAGVAGALYAMFNNFVSPSTVQLSQSVEGLLMAIVGGIGTLFGAFVGAAAIIAAGELRQHLHRALADGARPHVHRHHDFRPRRHPRRSASCSCRSGWKKNRTENHESNNEGNTSWIADNF